MFIIAIFGRWERQGISTLWYLQGGSFNCWKRVISNNFCSVLMPNPRAKVCVTLSRIDVMHQLLQILGLQMDKTTNVKRPRHIKSERASQNCYKQRISLTTFFYKQLLEVIEVQGCTILYSELKIIIWKLGYVFYSVLIILNFFLFSHPGR